MIIASGLRQGRELYYYNIMKDPLKASGHAKKLRFTQPSMVAELVRIARGNCRRALEARSPWKVGDRVSTYFREMFQPEFPLLSWSMEINAAAVSLISSPVEFNFCIAGNIDDPRMSVGKISDLIIKTGLGAISSGKWRLKSPTKIVRKKSHTIHAVPMKVDVSI